MIPLLGVVVLFALLALMLAVREAVAMVRLAPAGSALRGYFWFGWWKFGGIEAQIEPGAAPHMMIYKRAVITFLVFIVLGLVLSGWIVNGRGRGGDVAEMPHLLTDPRSVSAQFATQLTFPVHFAAQMPEPARQES